MAWMKHFQGNVRWAPGAGGGGLALGGWSPGPFAMSENVNSDLPQSKNLNSDTSRGGELTVWLGLPESSCC